MGASGLISKFPARLLLGRVVTLMCAVASSLPFAVGGLSSQKRLSKTAVATLRSHTCLQGRLPA